MAAYKLRGGSWVWSGTVAGKIGKTWDCNVFFVRRASSRDSNGSAVGFGASMEFDGSVTMPYEGSVCSVVEGISNPITKVMHVRVDTGLGDVDDQTTTTYQNYSSAGTVADIDLNGTWSITLDADLVQEDLAEDTNNTDGFPTFGGTAVPDTQNGIKTRQFLRARVGGNLVVTATVGGVTATATTAITSGNAFDVTEPTLEIGGGLTTSNYAGSLSMPAFWQGQALVGNAGFSHSNGGATANADSGVSMTTDSSASQSVNCTLEGWLERQWTMTLKARALEHEYPNSLTLKVHSKAGVDDTYNFTGSWTGSGSQKQWVAGATCNGNTKNESLNEYAPLKVWLDPTRLEELGELPTMWRILLRGQAYSALTVTHAASYAHTLTSATQAGPSDLVKSFADPLYLQSYRYLRVRVKANPGGPFTVKIGDKEWNKDRLGAALTVGNAFTWFEIDLCSPTNKTDTADTVDTIWPTPTVDGPYFGVTSVSEFRLTNLSAGVIYDLDANGLELNRVEPTDGVCTRTEWCPAFPGWVYSHTTVVGDVTTDFYYRRFGLGITNGRQSYEDVDFIKAVSTSESSGVTTTTYTVRTIENMKDSINLLLAGTPFFPGWTATYAASVDTADGAAGTDIFPNYLNKNRPMVWIYGGGIMYANGEWSYGFHVDTDDGPTLKAQQLYDSMEWIGGTGDTFLHEATPTTEGAIDLRAGVILRHGSHGLVLKRNGQNSPDRLVTQNATGIGSRGSGTTDDFGRYRTGLSYAIGTELLVVSVSNGTAASANTIAQPRKRQRVVLKSDIAGGGGPHNLTRRDGAYCAVCQDGDDVCFFYSTHSVPPFQITSRITNARRAKIACSPTRWMYVVFERDGSAELATSSDDGASWQEAGVMIAGGSWPDVAVGPDGVAAVTALVGGQLTIRVQNPGDSSFGSSIAAVKSDGSAMLLDETTYGLHSHTDGVRRWLLHCVISGETDTSHWECTDEEVFRFQRVG